MTLALLLLGCGGGGGSDGGPTGGEAPSPAPAPQADVTITSVGPTALLPSGSATFFDIAVVNRGPGVATDLMVNPNLSELINRSAVTCTATGGAVCPALTDEVFRVGNLAPGSGLTFRISGEVAGRASGHLSRPTTVTLSNDVSTGDNTVQSVLNAYTADLSVTAQGPTAAVAAGGGASYSAVVSNAGPDTARDVTILEWPNAGQSIVSIDCLAAGGAICPATTGRRMSVPTLPAGGTLQFSVVTTVPATTSGKVTNGVTVVSAGDPQWVNDSAVGQGTAVFSAPANANVLELRSDAGDFVGQGASRTYTQANAVLEVSASAGHLSVNVTGQERWTANFQLPASMQQVQPGTYSNLGRFGFGNPAVGGIEFVGEGRGCNSIVGAFTIDSAQYLNGQLSALNMSFEQHCEGAVQALRGQIRWSAGDTTAPAGPVYPPSATLWTPETGTVPSNGSYVYLKGEAADYITRGLTHTYTKANAALDVSVTGGHVSVRVQGDEQWRGEFQVMVPLTQVQPGFYGALKGYPFHNPTRGGLDWEGEGRGCNNQEGWFVVDDITYVNGVLAALDLRFEQHCESAVPALRGRVHWVANDATLPTGPVSPPPAGLWAPAAGATPAAANYVYLNRDVGTFAGMGQTATYTPTNASVRLTSDAAHLAVSIATATEIYVGHFQGISTQSQLQPGYYADLKRYPFNNPAKGGISWDSICIVTGGWFVIDDISYVNGAISSIDLRFEQRCEGNGSPLPALRGKIHWAP